ncbi:lysine-rich nucleolar protein 1-like, partial [Tupaia chinensis]|uniref:lysine-rich nucleolar protein 1-like n=1 Tax=Tupaia chinensis TaxID=246437 RepID=UPI000FFB9204
MITKTQKVDLGLGLPEKKMKKKVVKEPETQYSVLHNDKYFSDSSPVRATSLSKNVSETRLHARPADKSPSPRKQSLGYSEVCRGEKKTKRKSLLTLAVSHGSGTKTSPDRRPSDEVTRVGKKLKKHKKEKKAK